MLATMDAKSTPTGPQSALTRAFIMIALVEGAVLVAAVLLFTLDVIPFGIFAAIIAVCVAGSGIAILRAVRQQQARGPNDASGGAPGTASGTASAPESTIDRSNPFTH